MRNFKDKIRRGDISLKRAMIKLRFERHRLLSFFLWIPLFLWLFPDFIRPSQQTGEIVLRDEHLNICPKEFYVSDVIDDRSDKRVFAWLLPFNDAERQTKASPVDLSGGFDAVKRFIKNCIPQDTTLRPIVIHIKKFNATEAMNASGQAEGHAVLMISFDLRQDDETQHLVDYTGNASYIRTSGPAQDIEPTLRKMIGSSLDYFNNWINKQAAGDIRLAKSVSVSFSDYTENPEGDSVYYSPRRRLTWSDFKGNVPNSRYAAEVSPSIGYSERAEVQNGVVRLNLQIKVCLPKSACWAKDGVRGDAYTLNHEQRHFDLAKIAAMHFVQKIKAENLPVNNYYGFINFDYVDAYRQMDTLEMTYDNETAHGLDRFAQEKWNERIDKELKGLDVK